MRYLHHTRTSVRIPANRDAVGIGQIHEIIQRPFSRLFVGNRPWGGGEMKIACCTLEMITLIFLLFWSFNGAVQVLDAPGPNLISQSTAELIATWGRPVSVVTAAEAGFRTAQPERTEVWTYADPARTVVIRDDVVVSIRMG